jgi:hypothetical protein
MIVTLKREGRYSQYFERNSPDLFLSRSGGKAAYCFLGALRILRGYAKDRQVEVM